MVSSAIFKILFIVFICCTCYCLGDRKEIPIGGIFHHDNTNSKIIFLQQLQKRSNLYDGLFYFTSKMHKVSRLDSFKAGKMACNMSEERVAIIFGPQNRECSSIVSSICHNLKIPHITTHWDPTPPDDKLSTMTISMHPDADVLSEGYADILKAMDWKSFTIMYETDDALKRLQGVLTAHKTFETTITVRQLNEGPDYRALLKEIKASGETHIILDASPEVTREVLQQALDVQMLGEYMQYLLTNLDAHTVDYGEVKYDMSNITALRLINPHNRNVNRVIYDLSDKISGITEANLPTEMGLLYDAVDVFYHGLMMAELNQSIRVDSISCEDGGEDGFDQWDDGERLYSYIREVQLDDGLTGPIQFDENGRRTVFTLEFVELVADGFHQIATWDPIHRVIYNKTYDETLAQYNAAIRNKTFRVASRIGEPYLMYANESATGNARYRGYVMDLIDEISQHLGFKYEFYLAPDGNYGSYDKSTKKWDGLIKELLDRNADLAVCDLTITFDRRSAVDFTMPFMTVGISILFRKPIENPPAIFSFMAPLSFGVWVYTATAFLGVSFFLYIIARMCPKDWENPHPCNLEPDELENIWCLKNCIWLSLGSFMCQGCDLLPKGSSTRIATACWWFFALIVTQSYCANLTAFLTNERMDSSINSAEDLAKQTKIKYGVVAGGSTGNFFRDSNHSVYQKMYATMESTRPSVFLKNNNEGIERVKNGKGLFAFFMESSSIEYNTERKCELTMVGGKLDSKGYGIAMPFNSPYRTQISKTVLKLQEEGKLSQLKKKWWEEMDGGGTCKKDSGDEVANEMGFQQVAGVFVLLCGGCTTAFVISILEFLWNVRKVAVENKLTYSEALNSEFKFAIQIFNKSKPVKAYASESSSSDGDNRSIAASMLRGASSFLRLDAMFDKENRL